MAYVISAFHMIITQKFKLVCAFFSFMNCLSCHREIPTKLGYISNSYRYCSSCFSHIIERRIRKYIRESAPLKRNQRVVVHDPLSAHFIQHITHVPLVVIKKKQKKNDLVVLLHTLDDIVVQFLDHFLLGKKKILKKKNELWLFSSITDEELSLYCQYHHIRFVPQKHPLKEMILQLEKEHPGTVHA